MADARLVRVVLDGDGWRVRAVPCTDSYVNVAVPPADAPYAAPFALDDAEGAPAGSAAVPAPITVRRWDAESAG